MKNKYTQELINSIENSSFLEKSLTDQIFDKVEMPDISTEIKINKSIDYGDECWHFEGCNNRASKRLFETQDNVNLGNLYVHNQQNKHPHVLQLCQKHFEEKEYTFVVRSFSEKVENI